MEDGSLTEDAWEGESEDEGVSRECCEYGECPKWGDVFRAQRCREFGRLLGVCR
jgi:hypothetical protein